MRTAEHEITTLDGRVLAVHEMGDPHGSVIFAMHGTPGYGRVRTPVVENARALGLRLLAHDRPGYGGSSRKPGRTIADVAADVTAIADRLGIERFGVWGASGGGPHALACAALIPTRVTAAAVLASSAPHGAEGLDWLEGMGELNAVELDVLADGPERHMAWLREQADELLSGTPDSLRAALSSLLTPVDAEALTDEAAEWLFDQFTYATAQGVEGWHDEAVAGLGDWGFSVADISAPVAIWHGGQDRFCPIGHGRWLAEHVPGAVFHYEPGLGHGSLIDERLPDAQLWLASFAA